jgi:type I restriction enzyme M protein
MKSGIHLRQVINKLNEIDFNNSKDLHLFRPDLRNFPERTAKRWHPGRVLHAPCHHRSNDPDGQPCVGRNRTRPRLRHRWLSHRRDRAPESQRQHGRRARGDCPERARLGIQTATLHALANTNLVLHDITTPKYPLWRFSAAPVERVHPQRQSGCHSLPTHPLVAWCPTTTKTISRRPTAPKSRQTCS